MKLKLDVATPLHCSRHLLKWTYSVCAKGKCGCKGNAEELLVSYAQHKLYDVYTRSLIPWILTLSYTSNWLSSFNFKHTIQNLLKCHMYLESEKCGISSLLSIKNRMFPREIQTHLLPNSKKVDKKSHLMECPLVTKSHILLFIIIHFFGRWKLCVDWTLRWKEINKRHCHKLKILPVISWGLTHSFFRIAPRLRTAWLHYQASHQITTLSGTAPSEGLGGGGGVGPATFLQG